MNGADCWKHRSNRRLHWVKKAKTIANHHHDFDLCRLPSALKQRLLQIEAVHALEIESQADETPFPSGGGQAAQGELAKTEDFFDDANDRLHGALRKR